jgi:hypothetical protein
MIDHHPKRPPDPNQLAKSIIDSVTGQQPSPVDNSYLVKEEVARTTSQAPERHAEIAKKAARSKE